MYIYIYIAEIYRQILEGGMGRFWGAGGGGQVMKTRGFPSLESRNHEKFTMDRTCRVTIYNFVIVGPCRQWGLSFQNMKQQLVSNGCACQRAWCNCLHQFDHVLWVHKALYYLTQINDISFTYENDLETMDFAKITNFTRNSLKMILSGRKSISNYEK